jgi:hypothetical protein
VVDGDGAAEFDAGEGAAEMVVGEGAAEFDAGEGAAEMVVGEGAAEFDAGEGAAEMVVSVGAWHPSPSPLIVNCIVGAEAEKSDIVTPVAWPLRRDFRLGCPLSFSSALAPPLTHISVASPKLILFSRSFSPSAWTTATSVSVPVFPFFVSSTYQIIIPPSPEKVLSHSSGWRFSINKYSPSG